MPKQEKWVTLEAPIYTNMEKRELDAIEAEQRIHINRLAELRRQEMAIKNKANTLLYRVKSAWIGQKDCFSSIRNAYIEARMMSDK